MLLAAPVETTIYNLLLQTIIKESCCLTVPYVAHICNFRFEVNIRCSPNKDVISRSTQFR